MFCSGISAVHAEDDNVCYKEKKICEYEAIGREFEVTKYYDGSLLVETKDDDKYGEFRLDSDGNASVTTYNKGFFGLVTNKETNTFSIDYFDGERIKIIKDCVNSTDMDACLSSIENYINNSEYNSTNYIAEYVKTLKR